MDAACPPKPRTVLVVEDDDVTRAFLLDNLAADGFRVAGASGAGEGLRAMEVRQPALVVLDLLLDDGSGLALLDRVRAADGLSSRIDPDVPVIVLSGRAGDADRVRGFARGADDYVTKPSCRFPQRGIPLVERASSPVGNALGNARRPGNLGAVTPTRQDQLDALQRMGSYLLERDLYSDSPVQQLVNGTYARATSTFTAIHGLVANEHPLQAAMLSRPLFEDMVVAHWLALHDEDPDWLIERFLDHRDAMRLAEARARRKIGWSEPDVDDIIEREAELMDEYGDHAQKDWWGKHKDGSRVTVSRLVDLTSDAAPFHPRLKGEQRILQQYYAVVQKFATQCLHHTAAGMEVQLTREGGMPGIAPLPDETQVLAASYWTYGQLVYLVLELQPADFGEFQEIFLDGLYNIFGPAARLPGCPAVAPEHPRLRQRSAQ